MLYPVELQAQTLTTERTLGRGRGIRTLDIQLPKLALYQAELYPDIRNHRSRPRNKPSNVKGSDTPRQSNLPATRTPHRTTFYRWPCLEATNETKTARLAYFQKMVRPERFELPTTKFVAWYSIQLSYGRTKTIWLACAVRCRSTKKRNYSGFEPMRQHFW